MLSAVAVGSLNSQSLTVVQLIYKPLVTFECLRLMTLQMARLSSILGLG